MQVKKNITQYILLYVKGLAMGACDIVPGISGGTIAFITGIYEELINSLKSFTLGNIKLFFSGRFKEFWEAVNANFLLVLVLGVATAAFSLAKLVIYALENHHIILWSFFFGLISVSIFSILRTIRKFNIFLIFYFIIGAVFGYFITVLSAVQTPDNLLFVFFCGALAVCALLLPGLSGSFILLLLGKYHYILLAISEIKITILATFAAGAIVGLLSFSHFLSWVLRKYHDASIALLSGILLGSLNKIWPWKIQIDTATNLSWQWSIERFNDTSLSLLEKNMLPHTFAQMLGTDAQLFYAIVSASIAIAIYVIIDLAAKRKSH
jgi:putative membrane protein